MTRNLKTEIRNLTKELQNWKSRWSWVSLIWLWTTLPWCVNYYIFWPWRWECIHIYCKSPCLRHNCNLQSSIKFVLPSLSSIYCISIICVTLLPVSQYHVHCFCMVFVFMWPYISTAFVIIAGKVVDGLLVMRKIEVHVLYLNSCECTSVMFFFTPPDKKLRCSRSTCIFGKSRKRVSY